MKFVNKLISKLKQVRRASKPCIIGQSFKLRILSPRRINNIQLTPAAQIHNIMKKRKVKNV